MEHLRLGSRMDHVALLPDLRIDRTKRHLWLDMIVIAVCAVIYRCDRMAAGASGVGGFADHRHGRSMADTRPRDLL